MKLISDGGLTSWNTEDTMDAIMLTKNINYIDGVKLDVRISLDNILVLSKYNDLSINTLSKKKVKECNYDYLRKVKFPSHIFKYYIPTLDEVLKRYNKNKIIVLELYSDEDVYFNSLKDIIKKYSYNYYFISTNDNILEKIREKGFSELGEIVDHNSNVKIISNYEEELSLMDNYLLITKNPEKYRKIFFSTK